MHTGLKQGQHCSHFKHWERDFIAATPDSVHVLCLSTSLLAFFSAMCSLVLRLEHFQIVCSQRLIGSGRCNVNKSKFVFIFFAHFLSCFLSEEKRCISFIAGNCADQYKQSDRLNSNLKINKRAEEDLTGKKTTLTWITTIDHSCNSTVFFVAHINLSWCRDRHICATFYTTSKRHFAPSIEILPRILSPKWKKKATKTNGHIHKTDWFSHELQSIYLICLNNRDSPFISIFIRDHYYQLYTFINRFLILSTVVGFASTKYNVFTHNFLTISNGFFGSYIKIVGNTRNYRGVCRANELLRWIYAKERNAR